MATLYDRLALLCSQRGIKGGKMCTDLGISKSLMTDLKMGRKKSVSAETAQKISSYFNVSVGYLIGEESEKAPADTGKRKDVLDEVDIAFYGDFKDLDEDDKETVRDMVRVMRERRARKQGK